MAILANNSFDLHGLRRTISTFHFSEFARLEFGSFYFILKSLVLWASGSASLRGVGSCLYEPEASP